MAHPARYWAGVEPGPHRADYAATLPLPAGRRKCQPAPRMRQGCILTLPPAGDSMPNMVYSCGSLLHGRQLVILCAMSDYATTFATLSLDEVLAAMEQAQKRRGTRGPTPGLRSCA